MKGSLFLVLVLLTSIWKMPFPVWVAGRNLCPPSGNPLDLKLTLTMEDWPGRGGMMGYAGSPLYSTQVFLQLLRTQVHSNTQGCPTVAYTMVGDPLSSFTLVPCSGQSIVPWVLSFCPSQSGLVFVPFLAASPARHSIYHEY